jgi:hypothetical protein
MDLPQDATQFSAAARNLAALEIRWWREHHAKRRDKLLEALAQFYAALFTLRLDQSRSACKSFLKAVERHDAKTWGGQPDLAKFYTAIAEASGRRFDTVAVARLEETWWRLHDESVNVPEDSPLRTTIAELYRRLFGVPRDSATLIAALRVRAIHAHDLAEATSSCNESEHKWQEAESCLRTSYEVLGEFLTQE